jgi:hypothetical protein
MSQTAVEGWFSGVHLTAVQFQIIPSSVTHASACQISVGQLPSV